MITKNYKYALSCMLLNVNTIANARSYLDYDAISPIGKSFSYISDTENADSITGITSNIYTYSFKQACNVSDPENVSGHTSSDYKPLPGTAISNSTGCYLFTGASSKLPSEDDYKLGSLIPETSLKNIEMNCTHSVFNSIIVTKTLMNITNEDITVKEVGVYGRINGASNNLKYRDLLFAREVLTDPIIIKPGKSYTFTMTID